MSTKVISFERIIKEYPICRDFYDIYTLLTRDPLTTIKGSPLSMISYFEAHLYNSNTYLCDYLIWVMHMGDRWPF